MDGIADVASAIDDNPLIAPIRDLLLEQVVRFSVRAFTSLTTQDATRTDQLLAGTVLMERGDDLLLIDEAVASQIRLFLSSPTTESILRLRFLDQMASRSSRSHASTGDRLEAAFADAARDWCEAQNQSWATSAPMVWQSLQSFSGITDLSTSHSNDIATHFIFGSLTGTSPGKHIEVLLNLASSGTARSAIDALAFRARETALRVFTDEFQIQGDDETAKFDDLYVERTLVNSTSSLEVTPEIAFSSARAPVRAVVIGEPGAGKSTMVRRILRQTAERSRESAGVGRTPLLVLCREHLSSIDSLLEAIRSAFQATYSEQVSDQEIEYLLALGELSVVIDGLDEIPNTTKRASIVRQLETLALHYPLTPLIAATRRTGPEVQQLQATDFRIYSLSEYDEDQVREYAVRWFDMQSTPERAEDLLGQSRNLEDVRRNPLMLALLCGLFSKQEHIPQSRRGVYERCASLMFHEWDPKRGIKVPNIFKDRGTVVLQEVARRIYSVGGYGNTVNAKELHRLVQQNLESAGVDSVEASASARELLDYCTGRAWVLSARTVGGNLEFGFTHRTFFEFYLAEAIVKSASHAALMGDTVVQADSIRISPLTRQVWESWKDDSTSVLPELIVQSADNATNGMSPTILQELVRLSRHELKSRSADLTGLSVRLLAATGADRRVANLVLKNVIDIWEKPRQLGFQEPAINVAYESLEENARRDFINHVDRTFLALLEMPSANRAAFMAMVEDSVEARAAFQRRYSRIFCANETGLFGRPWLGFSESLPKIALNRSDVYVLRLEASLGSRSLAEAVSRTPAPWAFTIGTQGGVAGVFWEWIRSAEFDPEGEDEIKTQKRLTREIARFFYGPAISAVPRDIAHDLSRGSSATRAWIDVDLALVLAIVSGEDSVEDLEALTSRPLREIAATLRGLIKNARNSREADVQSSRSEMRRALKEADWPGPARHVFTLAAL